MNPFTFLHKHWLDPYYRFLNWQWDRKNPPKPDPTLQDLWYPNGSAEPTFGIQLPKGIGYRTHPPEKCAGRACVVHAPSDHHMRDWPTNYRADKGSTERICQHGTGHPDPDDLAYWVSKGQTWQGSHGCDGCCRPVKVNG